VTLFASEGALQRSMYVSDGVLEVESRTITDMMLT